MSSLISLVLKTGNGKYTPITVSINDETNEYGQNVSAWKEQTREQRLAKEKRDFVGNGKVIWTDGSITAVKKKEEQETESDDFDLF